MTFLILITCRLVSELKCKEKLYFRQWNNNVFLIQMGLLLVLGSVLYIASLASATSLGRFCLYCEVVKSGHYIINYCYIKVDFSYKKIIFNKCCSNKHNQYQKRARKRSASTKPRKVIFFFLKTSIAFYNKDQFGVNYLMQKHSIGQF